MIELKVEGVKYTAKYLRFKDEDEKWAIEQKNFYKSLGYKVEINKSV